MIIRQSAHFSSIKNIFTGTNFKLIGRTNIALSVLKKRKQVGNDNFIKCTSLQVTLKIDITSFFLVFQ